MILAQTQTEQASLFVRTVLPLIPVVAGGLIAMAASLGSGLYQHRLKTRAENTAYKRDKLERFVAILNRLHHLGLSPDQESELEQSRKWVELITEMTVITQIHFPELMQAGVVIMTGGLEFAKAGQRMFALANAENVDPEVDKQINEDYLAKRAESQVAWEYAMDQAQILARRLGLHGKFKPLSEELMFNQDDPPKGTQPDTEPD